VTCIVGVKTETGVLLAGDALGSNGWSGTPYKAPKVFRLSRQVAAGFTSSFRMGQLLQHHLTLPTLHGDELAWTISELVPVIRQTFKDHGYAEVRNNEETGGTFLLAIRARLFVVQGDYAVLETRHPYDAVGCGQDYAMGAMHALWKPKTGHSPAAARSFLRAAIDAASEFSLGVGPPYNFTTTAK
jgi:ATP-dependent protease HslVU (ClpYQ) peptidase subunit